MYLLVSKNIREPYRDNSPVIYSDSYLDGKKRYYIIVYCFLEYSRMFSGIVLCREKKDRHYIEIVVT